MRMYFECEEAKHQTAKTAIVILKDGELSPWHYPTPYQFAPMNAEMLLEIEGISRSENDLVLAA